MNYYIWILIYELLLAIQRKFNRRTTFAKAVAKSKETGKKLLVIGDPDNGVFNSITGTDYNYGDECIDLTGCPNAPKDVIVHKTRLEDTTLNFDDYVVFISCVLEYVDDPQGIVNRLRQMDQSNLFVVHVEWYSLASYFYPYFLTNEMPAKNVFFDNLNYYRFDPAWANIGLILFAVLAYHNL